MRLRCWLCGCDPDPYDPDEVCPHCGFSGGRRHWLRWQWWQLKTRVNRWRYWLRHECAECRKPMWFGGGLLCSEKCQKQWIPF